MLQGIWLPPRPSELSFLCHCWMKWKIPIEWMASSYKLGCLGKSVVLWLVFSLGPNVPTCTCFVHVKLNPRCHSTLSVLVPRTAVHKRSDWHQPLGTLEYLHITESIWKDRIAHGVFVGKFLCGEKAPLSGHMTDALQTYTLAYE